MTAETMTAVVAFDEALPPGSDPVALLGGKGAGLMEMTRALALPVPPGFIITTEQCRRYLAAGWQPELDGLLDVHLEQLGKRLGLRLGDPDAPLLLSVRSGAPVSMPGMMDTLLNAGMTPAVRDALAARHGEPFAADTWLRFCRMYAEIVLGVPSAALATAAATDGTPAAMRAAAQRVQALAAGAGGIPTDPRAQVRRAVAAVFRSWHSERARAFRVREGIAESLGTAVTVQAMVFGNLGPRSGTGVVFTRNPATGEPGPFGDYLAGAQGEDVVAGTHAVGGLDAFRAQAPEAYAELLAVLDRLEHHYRDMCDVEFTVSEGRLFILQTRPGRRSPPAAVRIAVAMAEDPSFPLSRAEAVARIDAGVLQQLARLGAVRATAVPLARGLAASPGAGAGVLCTDPDRAADLAARGIATVLAREETSPSDIHGMVGAAALLTTLGGVASHAAVVARSWAIPAVTSLQGTQVLAAGIRAGDHFIAEGEVVTVDGSAGALYAGDQREEGSGDLAELHTLRRWAAELGIDLGAPAAVAVPTDPGRDADVTLLELARTVQLKGMCTTERAAAVLAVAAARVEELVAGNGSLFRAAARGMMLTPEGRGWVSEQLAAERATLDATAFATGYEPFLTLNHRFKEVVSGWQLTPEEGRTAAAWNGVVAAVAAIDAELAPLIAAAAAQVPRLGAYARHFDAALAAMRAGDRTMLASPLKDSYHTAWFEYHEELIALSGRSRSAED